MRNQKLSRLLPKSRETATLAAKMTRKCSTRTPSLKVPLQICASKRSSKNTSKPVTKIARR